MSAAPDPPAEPGRGRSLAAPAFPDDDGSADPSIRARVADESDAAGGVIALARMLRQARLLSCVVAVADEADPDGGDTSSHMAAVSMVNERGEKGLLAFTGVDSLAAWSPTARPVPALGREMAQAALSDGAHAVVIDVAGPHRRVISGTALRALADELDVAQVAELIRVALAPVAAECGLAVEVVDARPLGSAADVLVTVAAGGPDGPTGRDLVDVAMRAARVLAGSEDINALVPGGIGVTTGPPGGSMGT